MPNFIEIARTAVEISQFLDFFKMAAAVILDFKNFNCRTRQEGRTTSLCQISTKSLQSRPTCGDYLLFKMAAAAIFDFWNFSFLTIGTAKKVDLCHQAKFRRNRLNCGEIWWFFDFFSWRLPPSRILKISNFYDFTGGRIFYFCYWFWMGLQQCSATALPVLSVCLSVCPLAYLKNSTSKFHQIFWTCYLWPFSVLWRQYNVLCTSGFMDDVMFFTWRCMRMG